MPPEVLSAPLIVEFPFTRSTGPVLGAFLTGLRERVVLGVRGSDGRVICPPAEYDPVTAEELTHLVPLGQLGTVTTWAWNASPRPYQPLDTPFAWVLVRLDGADTALLHALDAPRASVRTGMRVAVRWAEERTGAITDIACFVPVTDAATPTDAATSTETASAPGTDDAAPTEPEGPAV
ncbi:OB-fold domain-containing protein [Streptacidiphilus sp. NEAU-YB345]|uniref:OB-fold domain-containing protein n=1 Tax=Streptacidiphilus fuscans TaxID=2789292 RepID=A0A931B421_9ACTN|nr:OB-fold domain-containing protein [Streptacidiphilus fuscans]